MTRALVSKTRLGIVMTISVAGTLMVMAQLGRLLRAALGY